MRRLLVLLMITFTLVGCTRKIYVPVETEKIKYRDRVLVDSIYQRDSIFIYSKGDTVWKERYQYIYRDKLIRDSVYMRDSVSYPVYVDVVKEVKHVPRFTALLASVGGAAIFILIGWLIFRIRKLFF